MATQMDDRQMVNRAALSALGNTANLSLDVIMGDINTYFANATFLPTASVLMTRDANANTQANNFLAGFVSTATAAGTTTLTVASKEFQQFTGSTTQTVVLPAANTLTLGQSFVIANRSTGNITVQNGTPTTIQTMTANSQAVFTASNIGSVAGTWDISYTVTGPQTFLQTQVTTDSTTTGSAATLLSADILVGNVRLTNGSLVSVSGIPAGSAGQQIIVENQTGNTITINNNDAGATAANRIFTGTGGAAQMAANASFAFVYDVTTARWMLVGGTGSGSGSGSGKNYLSVYTASTSSGVPNTGNGNFELGSTTGWTLGTIGTLTNGLPTGSPTFGSGASGNLSISTVSGGTQIGGSYSLSYASSAATTQGNMVASNAFFIDAEDQGKVLTVKFYYQIASGAANDNFSGTSSNSFGWAIYDVTNSNWIGTAGQFGMTQNSGVGYVTGTFQTAINTAQLRLCIYNVNATTGATTLYFDDISVGPQTAPIGAVITDWVAYTPTGSFTTNTTYTGQWRKVGADMEVQAYLTLSGAPTVTGGRLSVNLPSGYSIDTTKLIGSVANATPTVGRGILFHSPFDYTLSVYYDTTTSFSVTAMQVSGSIVPDNPLNGTNPVTLASGDTVALIVKFPIVGWSSNVQMSSDTDTRVVAMRATASTGASMGTPTGSLSNTIYNTVQNDTHGAYNSSTGIYTVPVSGYYAVIAGAQLSATVTAVNQDITLVIIQNTSTQVAKDLYTYPGTGVTGGINLSVATTAILCNAGDTLKIQCASAATGPAYVTDTTNFLTINRLSGPSVIAATESVSASYNSTSGQSITNNSNTTLTSLTKLYDSHNAMNASTGVYTVPVSGKYSIKGAVQYAAFSAVAKLVLSVSQNGSTVRNGPAIFCVTTSNNWGNGLATEISCNAGDTIAVQAFQNSGSSQTLVTTTGGCYVDIARIGN